MINLVTLYLPATPALGPMPMILYARHGAVQDLRAGKFISTRPSLVLIGHSLGGAACVAAGLHVPSLFARVVAVEPILFDHETYPLGELVPLDKFAIKKPIVLPNREAIKGFAKKHPVWATYTPEVLDKALVRHSLVVFAHLPRHAADVFFLARAELRLGRGVARRRQERIRAQVLTMGRSGAHTDDLGSCVDDKS